jgi:undecaprenyl-diphosphatase
MSQHASRSSKKRRLQAAAGAWLGALAVLILVFIWLGAMAAGAGVIHDDVRITRSIQEAPIPAAAQIARFGSGIGSFSVLAPLTLFVLVVLIWRRWRADALFLAVAGVLHGTNSLLKRLIDSPRPTPDLVAITGHASGNGFPSGHATGSTLIFGALAIIVARHLQQPWLRRAIVAMCIALIIIVGFARVKEGVHWPSDVLGGYLWGLAMLLVADAVIRSLMRKTRT